MKIKLNPVATVTAGLVLGSTLYVANLYAQTLEYLQLNKEIQTQISAGTEVKDIILQYMNSDRDPTKLVNSLLTIPSLGMGGINEVLQTIKEEANIAMRNSNEGMQNARNAPAQDAQFLMRGDPDAARQNFESIASKVSQIDQILVQVATNTSLLNNPYQNINPAVMGIIDKLSKSVDDATLAALIDKASQQGGQVATDAMSLTTPRNLDMNKEAKVAVDAFLQQAGALALVPVEVMTKAVISIDPTSSDNLTTIIKAYGASDTTATTVMKEAMAAGMTPSIALSAAIAGGADPTKITAATASGSPSPAPAPAPVAGTPVPLPAVSPGFSGSSGSTISGGGGGGVSSS